MAEHGAECAVHSVTEHLLRGVDAGRSDFRALMREAAAEARQAVMTEAALRNTELRQLASTLLAIVITPEGGGALQIGDGVVVVRDDAGGWSWMFWPQRGEFANTTYFLSDQDALARAQIDEFSTDITDVAVMSDGLEPLALHYATRTVHAPFCDGLLQPLVRSEGSAEVLPLSKDLEQFLSSDRVRSRIDDDVSIVLATRRNHIDANR